MATLDILRSVIPDCIALQSRSNPESSKPPPLLTFPRSLRCGEGLTADTGGANVGTVKTGDVLIEVGLSLCAGTRMLNERKSLLAVLLVAPLRLPEGPSNSCDSFLELADIA
jgi:hypothetical protein